MIFERYSEEKKPKEERRNAEFKENYSKLLKKKKAFVGSIKILEDKEIKAQAKILFFIISSLSYKTGYCFAFTKRLSEKLNLKETQVKINLKILESKGYIIRETEGGRRGWRRKIYINFDKLMEDE
ncbi:MAG TPA: helix-turn-helix domain-containing protein [Bacteroidia bacterium]|nr:helix-turn-helix domain-containing protein [Bacteroidia bacterium]